MAVGRAFNGIYPNVDVGVVVEVLVDKRLRQLSSRLHGLKALHGLLKAAGEVLGATGGGVVGGTEEFAW